jgi:hypothetical protein
MTKAAFVAFVMNTDFRQLGRLGDAGTPQKHEFSPTGLGARYLPDFSKFGALTLNAVIVGSE